MTRSNFGQTSIAIEFSREHARWLSGLDRKGFEREFNTLLELQLLDRDGWRGLGPKKFCVCVNYAMAIEELLKFGLLTVYYAEYILAAERSILSKQPALRKRRKRENIVSQAVSHERDAISDLPNRDPKFEITPDDRALCDDCGLNLDATDQLDQYHSDDNRLCKTCLCTHLSSMDFEFALEVTRDSIEHPTNLPKRAEGQSAAEYLAICRYHYPSYGGSSDIECTRNVGELAYYLGVVHCYNEETLKLLQISNPFFYGSQQQK